MDNRSTQDLADKIALLLQESHLKNDDDLLRKSLEKINQRLDRIELQMGSESARTISGTPKPPHISQKKFSSLEVIADEIIVGLQEEKACPYEPTGKPCDHCSMCSSLGF